MFFFILIGCIDLAGDVDLSVFIRYASIGDIAFHSHRRIATLNISTNIAFHSHG